MPRAPVRCAVRLMCTTRLTMRSLSSKHLLRMRPACITTFAVRVVAAAPVLRARVRAVARLWPTTRPITTSNYRFLPFGKKKTGLAPLACRARFVCAGVRTGSGWRVFYRLSGDWSNRCNTQRNSVWELLTRVNGRFFPRWSERGSDRPRKLRFLRPKAVVRMSEEPRNRGTEDLTKS